MTADIVDLLFDALNKDPLVFLGMFLVSLLANFLAIIEFIRNTRALREERNERKKLAKLVDTYEYVLNLAKRSIKGEEELKGVEEDISKKRNLVGDLSARIESVRKAAQHRLVTQLLERNLGVLFDAYQDIMRLRKEYEFLGPLPDIPAGQREQIEKEVSVAIKRPYEVPKSFAFKSVLLVLFLFMLPYPLDRLFLLFFLPLYLKTFFEAVLLYEDATLVKWVIRHSDLVIAGSTIGVWLSVFSFFVAYVGFPLQAMFPGLYPMLEILQVVPPFFVGLVHWTFIRRYVLSPVRERALPHH